MQNPGVFGVALKYRFLVRPEIAMLLPDTELPVFGAALNYRFVEQL